MNKFVLLFLHTAENNFGEQKEHVMKEWSIHNEYTSLVLKNSWITLKGITVHFLHFALISMDTEILGFPN